MNILQDQTLLQLIHEPLIAADYIEEMGKPFLAKCVRESIESGINVFTFNDNLTDGYFIDTFYASARLRLWLIDNLQCKMYYFTINEPIEFEEDIKFKLDSEGLVNLWDVYKEKIIDKVWVKYLTRRRSAVI
jgi:hypothetical protein